MDKEQSGFITPDELKEALNLEHFDFNEEQIDSIMKQVDIQANGKINYEEFIEATVVLEKFMIEERMWIVFRHLDVDDANTIKRENIKEAMKQLGKELTEDEIKALLKTKLKHKDKEIMFSEFRDIFEN